MDSSSAAPTGPELHKQQNSDKARPVSGRGVRTQAAALGAALLRMSKKIGTLPPDHLEIVRLNRKPFLLLFFFEGNALTRFCPVFGGSADATCVRRLIA